METILSSSPRQSFIFCHSERNLGISWKRLFGLFLSSCSLHVVERGGAPAPERGLLPDYSQKLFNKDKGNYKTSILFSLNFASLNSASFPASWGSQGVMYMFARKSPPLGESKCYSICLRESCLLLGKPRACETILLDTHSSSWGNN